MIDRAISIARSALQAFRRARCAFLGHGWKIMPYDPAPHGWVYENLECCRCGEKSRCLVASGMG